MKRENMKTYFRTEEPGYENLAATVAASMVDEYRETYKKYLAAKTEEEEKLLYQQLLKIMREFQNHVCWKATTDMDFSEVADIIEKQEDKK